VTLNGCNAYRNGHIGIGGIAGSDRLSITGGESKGNGQTTTATYNQVDISGVDTRITGHVSDAGQFTNKCARGFMIWAAATGARLYGCTVRGTFTSANYLDQAASDIFPVLGVAKPAAITAPTAPGAAYVQAEAAAMKTAVDAIRAALTARGITS